ncbi:MAG: hypothetical protein JW893_03570 [Candidatus Omnitrophica bacterium]|nr:hypothetical protein [Candidatus Omnitrophota bacterium]
MKIRLYHANAGQGHKRVAEVLEKAFLRSGLSAQDVKLEDILDHTPAYFRKAYPAVYFYMVKYCPGLWGWIYETLDQPKMDRLFGPINSFSNRVMGRGVLEEVMKEKPHAIISTHFFPAELFARAKREGKLRSKLITVVTDFYPHAYWLSRGTDLYWIMSEEGKEALMKKGVEEKNIRVGGIPVDPIFLPRGKKSEILKKWGFQDDRLTVLVTSGSFGLGPQEGILKALDDFHDRVQCFVVCGYNEEMKRQLETKSYRFPVKIFGFVDFMHDLMEASDLMIAKPGGATTTESLAKGVPMIVIDPIPGQEMWNTKILKTRNAAFMMKKPEDVRLIMGTIFKNPGMLEEKKRIIRELAKPNASDDLVREALRGVEK